MAGYWPKRLGHDGISLALVREALALLRQPWLAAHGGQV
jgi:hypothetical protein